MPNQIQSFYDKLLFYSSFKQLKFKKKLFLKKLKRLVKVIQNLFRHLKSSYFCLTLISFLCWITKSTLSLGKAKILGLSRIWLFGVMAIKLNTYIFLQKKSLQRTEQLIITCCYFEVRNLFVLQTINMPMDIDAALFWANFRKLSDFLIILVKLIVDENFKRYSNKFITKNCF